MADARRDLEHSHVQQSGLRALASISGCIVSMAVLVAV